MTFYLLTLLNVMAGIRHENGHKTWVAWLIVGVTAVLGIGARIYRARRRTERSSR